MRVSESIRILKTLLEMLSYPMDTIHPGALILVTILGVMTPGMVFTIEPCVSEGDRRVKILSDGWTAITLVS